MDSRERITRILNFEETDAVGYADSDIYPEPLDCWKNEGLPSSVKGAKRIDSRGSATN